MRRVAVCLLGLLLVTQAVSQDGPATAAAAPASSSAALTNIEATRARETAAFDAQEAACYQRFAVSGCVRDVLSKRHAMLADLRRQEATLHEKEFAAQGVERLRSAAQKAEERKQQQAELHEEKVADRQVQVLQTQQKKQAEHAQKIAQAASAPGVAGATARSAASGPTPAEQATNRDSYARKQADIEKKRQEIARRLAEKGAKPAAPLPLPTPAP